MSDTPTESSRLPDTMLVEDLELSVRASNVLAHQVFGSEGYKIRTVGDLRQAPAIDLKRALNLGKVTLRELRSLVPYEPDAPFNGKDDRLDARLKAIEAELRVMRVEITELRWHKTASLERAAREVLLGVRRILAERGIRVDLTP